MRSLTGTLVTEGLGYCCPWAFFSIFRKTPEIAARLGVCEMTVRRAKARVDDKIWKCEECGHCMKKQVHLIRLIGKKSLAA